MLKITKASDPIEVKTVVLNLYAVPGVGKTSTAFTAEDPLLFDFDQGSYRSANRRDSVQIASWADAANVTADDLKGYKTLVVDTAGRALDHLAAHIIKSNPKAGNRMGGLSLQGFGELKSAFISWTKLIRSFGLDIVLLCHSDEQRNGDELIERLDMQGGSKNEIYKAADVMGRLYMHGGKRWLNFSPTDTSFGKNPAQLPPIEVPDFAQTPDFLATTIATIKDRLNALSEEQKAVAGMMAEWQTAIGQAANATDFNCLLPSYKKADKAVKENVWRLINKAAIEKGLKFDKKAGFVEAAAA